MKVLITGCSTGIGRGLACEFASRGAVVLATARKLESIADLEGMCSTAVVDVTKPETLALALKQFGPVDICVANAGAGVYGPLLEQDLEHIEALMRTNVLGVVSTAKAAAPGMIARNRGLIVVIGSVSRAMITPYAGAYCASKAAVTAICDTLRMELSPWGIQVMEVVTGSVRSALSENAVAGGKCQLPEESRYAKVQPFIDARANLSQNPLTAMDPSVFAKSVVDSALQARPPARMTAGGHASFFDLAGRYCPHWFMAIRWQTMLGINTLAEGSASPNFLSVAIATFGRNQYFIATLDLLTACVAFVHSVHELLCFVFWSAVAVLSGALASVGLVTPSIKS